MRQHTKEPWEYYESEENDVWPQEINIGSHNHHSNLFHIAAKCQPGQSEVARRIVACVNACAGIPTDDLEFSANRPNSYYRLSNLQIDVYNAIQRNLDGRYESIVR